MSLLCKLIIPHYQPFFNNLLTSDHMSYCLYLTTLFCAKVLVWIQSHILQSILLFSFCHSGEHGKLLYLSAQKNAADYTWINRKFDKLFYCLFLFTIYVTIIDVATITSAAIFIIEPTIAAYVNINILFIKPIVLVTTILSCQNEYVAKAERTAGIIL